MKTINVMMASLAALLVAACSQNEVTEVSPDAHPADEVRSVHRNTDPWSRHGQ